MSASEKVFYGEFLPFIKRALLENFGTGIVDFNEDFNWRRELPANAKIANFLIVQAKTFSKTELSNQLANSDLFRESLFKKVADFYSKYFMQLPEYRGMNRNAVKEKLFHDNLKYWKTKDERETAAALTATKKFGKQNITNTQNITDIIKGLTK